MSKKDLAARVGLQVGGGAFLAAYWGKHRLTVLNYHRITDYDPRTFPDYLPLVSATPTDFERQMAWVDAHYNVIHLDDLHAALNGNGKLPDNPALITFDDGYLDNYTVAYPILKRFGFPAVIFLTTSRMENPSPLWWDAVARYFHYSDKNEADLPLVGVQAWDKSDLRPVLDPLLAAMKTVPEDEKLAAVEAVRVALDVTPPDAEPLFMDWQQARELIDNGIACQGHTVTHPIMSRISPQEQHRQLAESRQTILDRTGQPVYAFAYPNGGHADYTTETMRILHETGYTLAFTLAAGPMRWQQVQQHPLQIRRVYMGYHDTFALFKAKMLGVPAFGTQVAFPQASG
jgi:peptidoglycan/xylan/chitin deacetylase (PgdA/CDA1 family)